METATLAGGCFWCTEAIFKRLKGVTSVMSGYSGGTKENPTYEEVCTGSTGHAESIQIEFDPGVISYDKILEIFFALHDPTTKDRQGDDVGTQYRSAIFYHDEEQKRSAEKIIAELNSSGNYQNQIVTKIAPATTFYPAEHHHQNFYDSNENHPYCRLIIDPKIKKLLDHYRENIKEEYLKS